MSSDRPLSDAQERALIVLGDRTAPNTYTWVGSGYHGVRTNTMFSLERLGLARVRLDVRWSGAGYEAQITQAGVEMLASMGD